MEDRQEHMHQAVYDFLVCICASTETLAAYPAETALVQEEDFPALRDMEFHEKQEGKAASIHIGISESPILKKPVNRPAFVRRSRCEERTPYSGFL